MEVMKLYNTLGTAILAMCTSLTISLLIRPGTRLPKINTKPEVDNKEQYQIIMTFVK
jgi:hypothetical protein